MTYRHRPFGIPEQALRQELLRRRLAHRAAIAPVKAELARRRRHNAELRRYLTLLGAEIISLEEEERRLARDLAALAESGATTPEPTDGTDPLDTPRRTLQRYRSLQEHLIASVLSLIAPFLGSDPSGTASKEERTWPSTRSERGSGFGPP